jgi:hypothetical protein
LSKFYRHFKHLLVIWYIFSYFGMLHQENTGNPDDFYAPLLTKKRFKIDILVSRNQSFFREKKHKNISRFYSVLHSYVAPSRGIWRRRRRRRFSGGRRRSRRLGSPTRNFVDSGRSEWPKPSWPTRTSTDRWCARRSSWAQFHET